MFNNIYLQQGLKTTYDIFFLRSPFFQVPCTVCQFRIERKKTFRRNEISLLFVSQLKTFARNN